MTDRRRDFETRRSELSAVQREVTQAGATERPFENEFWDCQLVVATHSPILMSCPGAEIWCFEAGRVAPRAVEELEPVRFTWKLLKAPERYWRLL